MEANKTTNKLISLSERVDQILTADRICDRGQMLEEIGLYNKFLKQLLTLGMFVPCDNQGNVLDEPKMHHSFDETGEAVIHEKEYISDQNKYQQADEKVLFKGFYIHHGELYYPNQVHFETALFGQDWFNIENLLQNAYQPIQLTDYGAICAGM